MFPFNRLINELTKIIETDKNETFFSQYGHTKVNEKVVLGQPFLSEEEFDAFLDRCSCLITHGGTSNVIKALKKGKKVILVPRLKEYGEHVDDHQLELAEFVETNNFGLVIRDIKELSNSIEQIKKMRFEDYVNDNGILLSDIRSYILGGS